MFFRRCYRCRQANFNMCPTVPALNIATIYPRMKEERSTIQQRRKDLTWNNTIWPSLFFFYSWEKINLYFCCDSLVINSNSKLNKIKSSKSPVRTVMTSYVTFWQEESEVGNFSNYRFLYVSSFFVYQVTLFLPCMTRLPRLHEC